MIPLWQARARGGIQKATVKDASCGRSRALLGLLLLGVSALCTEQFSHFPPKGGAAEGPLYDDDVSSDSLTRHDPAFRRIPQISRNP